MKRLRRSYFISFIFAFALLGSMLFGNRPASALVSSQPPGSSPSARSAQQPMTANSTVVVTAANMQGWFFLNEGGIGSGAMVTGPSAPPLGSGSVGLTIGADGREDVDTQHFANTRLDQITALSFSTYSPTNTQAVTLQLDVNYDGGNHWEGRLVYEPYMNGTVTPNAWQNWDAKAAGAHWWASGAPGNTNCGQSTPCTLAQILGYWPNATISAASAGGELLLRAGGPWPTGTYNADALTVGVGGNNTTYDFANSQTLTVDDNNSPCTTAAYSTIQSAVDAASPGDIVQVCGGTYVEQLDINKAITVNGSGQGSAIIQSPAHLNTCFTTSGPNCPVVYIHDTMNAVVQNLTVDGQNQGSANNRMDGVAFYNAGGTLDHTTIINIEDTSFDGVQAGIGIYANNQDSASRTLNIDHNTLHDYQKNGMALSGTGLAANVTNNTVMGHGPTSITAQNGIEISSGATGLVSNNTVSGHSYTPFNVVACGILIIQSDAQVLNNTLSENQVGAYHIEGAATDTGNTVSATNAGTGSPGFWGIIMDAPPANRQPSPFESSGQSKNRPAQIATVQTSVANNNVFNSDGHSGGIALETDGGFGAADINFVANHNTINHWDTGLDIFQCSPSCTGSNFNNVVASNNTITNNNIGILVEGGQITGPIHLNNNHIQGNTLYGIRNTTSPATIVDGSNNWWGATGRSNTRRHQPGNNRRHGRHQHQLQPVRGRTGLCPPDTGQPDHCPRGHQGHPRPVHQFDHPGRNRPAELSDFPLLPCCRMSPRAACSPTL